MVTDAQINFFQKLLEEKDFGAGSDPAALLEQFKALNKKSASVWIEKAMSLPKRDDSNDPIVAPTF